MDLYPGEPASGAALENRYRKHLGEAVPGPVLKKEAVPMFTLKDPTLFRQQCYIKGEWSDALGGRTIPVSNPATGEIIGTVPKMGTQETRAAIAAAEAAFPAWRAKTAAERAQLLRRWFELMLENQDDLAIL